MTWKILVPMYGDAVMLKDRTLKNDQCLRVGICFATSSVADGCRRNRGPKVAM